MLQDLLEYLDNNVARRGWGPFIGWFFSALAIAAAIGAILGAPWLRATLATLLLLATLFTLACLIYERRRLHARIETDADTINRYVDAISQRKPFAIRNWSQEVTIQPNGDATIHREVTISSAGDDEPHFLKVNSVYYGSRPLSPQDKRQVRHRAYRREGESDSESRAHSTYSWTSTDRNKARQDVIVHLEGGTEDNEVVIVEWDWPGFSSDLMRGVAPEVFDVRFTASVARFTYSIRVKEARKFPHQTANRRGNVAVTREWQGDDWVVSFSSEAPSIGRQVGVTLDFRR